MNLKEQAAREALNYVKSGTVIGLGTGSTVKFFTEMLGEKIKKGEFTNIVAIPTSEDTANLAKQVGIPLSSLEDYEILDIAVDGADEVDPNLNLIKGLGKALLREKMVETHAKHLIIVVDESKVVQKLGTKGPLPIEIVPFAAKANIRWLNMLGCVAELWMEDGKPAVTDNGNYLAKCTFANGIEDAYALAQQLEKRPGIVEHGLFLDMAKTVIIGKEKGPEIRTKK